MTDRYVEFLTEQLKGGVTPDGPGSHTWTYSPDVSMSVTVSASAGLRIAARLFWDSLVALVRRDTVTFEAGSDIDHYTMEYDA